ncbi:Histidine ammonia-lyase [Lasiodiplodia theobromae]|uniref:Histidine ammonia-lyase n=1 Tax=Lasiodiplodia theobromae TaxID=45133 RepID=UPI0015C31932|nr:Histidine ammonia-lyase [Lasiodiplodia theobromae]KAF4535508.1 Histidine ammonia-lyase [Lasiodiplodia theobromae]
MDESTTAPAASFTTTTTTTAPHTPIATAATAFLASYARAMHLADPSTSATKSTNIPLIAAALGAHYGAGCTAYTLSHRASLPSADAWVPGIATHLERFDRCGLGYDIFLARHRVEPVSEGSALCWATWRIRPRAGSETEGWEWENVYAYRRAPTGTVGGGGGGGGGGEAGRKIGGEGADAWEKPEGWWEFIVSDNEISGLLARVPNFMEL